VAPTAYCNAASPTATTSTSSTWFHGEQVSPFLTTNQKNYLGTGALSGTAQTLPWSGFDTFYAFPNNNTTTQTRLEIKGTYKTSTSDAGTTVYYPIIINHSATGTTFTGTSGSTTPDGTDGVILNNKVYSLSATITAKGVTDPSQVFTNSTPVTVTMSVNQWSTTTNQNTNFGPTAAVTTDGTTYLYSDGTWGTAIPDPTATPHVIGVAFSNTTSTADQARGWSHGYAIAVTNAVAPTAGVTWSAGSTQDQTTDYTTAASFIANKDGYTETQHIQATKTPSSSSYQAFYYALSYGTANVAGTSTYAAPSSGTSGWYLPSVGQQYDVCVNLGKMSTGFTNSGYTSGVWARWYNGDVPGTDYPLVCANNINSVLNNLSTKGYTVNTFTNQSEKYWSSSECNNTNAYYLNFGNVGGLDFTGNNGKTPAYGVRPVIAF
jgi:hypothetical protein